jgi:hypothetical protein
MASPALNTGDRRNVSVFLINQAIRRRRQGHSIFIRVEHKLPRIPSLRSIVRHTKRYYPSKLRHGKPNYQKTALSTSKKMGNFSCVTGFRARPSCPAGAKANFPLSIKGKGRRGGLREAEKNFKLQNFSLRS